jgi:hypothetical protein
MVHPALTKPHQLPPHFPQREAAKENSSNSTFHVFSFWWLSPLSKTYSKADTPIADPPHMPSQDRRSSSFLFSSVSLSLPRVHSFFSSLHLDTYDHPFSRLLALRFSLVSSLVRSSILSFCLSTRLDMIPSFIYKGSPKTLVSPLPTAPGRGKGSKIKQVNGPTAFRFPSSSQRAPFFHVFPPPPPRPSSSFSPLLDSHKYCLGPDVIKQAHLQGHERAQAEARTCWLLPMLCLCCGV